MGERSHEKAAEEDLDASDLRMAVVVSRYNVDISKRLLRGALEVLEERGADDPQVVWVPGALELPLAALTLAESGSVDAIVALGCVINFPAHWKDPDNVLSPVYRIGIVGILYNTKLVRPDEAPKTLEDFLNPRWRGKWVIPDPSQDFTTGQWLRNLEKVYGADWLPLVRKLAETRPILVESFTPSTRKIISGEALAGISYVRHVYSHGKDGAPLDYVRLPKMLAEGQNAAISVKAPHPSAAKLFYNFLISREGMELEAKQGEFVTAKGIYPPIKDAEKINPVIIDELSSDEFAKWAAEFRRFFVSR